MNAVDLFSFQFKQDPFPTYAELRQHSPIYGIPNNNGRTSWYITRYEDVLTILKDNLRFSKDPNALKPQSPKGTNATPSPTHTFLNHNMLFADPPNHTRLRSLVNLAFSPRQVERLLPRIQTISNELLDSIEPNGRFDLISTLALPLPLIIITELLGIPEEDRDQLCDWSQLIISPHSRGISAKKRRKGIRALLNYLQQLFLIRQQEPADDLISALIQAEEAGDKLSAAECSSMVALLLVTGYETTVNLIGNALFTLLQHPDQLAQIKTDPALIPNAIEELLRFDGPVETSTTRWATEDLLFLGKEIKRGDIIRVVLSSANRDEQEFSCPNQFDIHRSDKQKHLAFGFGIHYCLGAPLARAEARIALETLLHRFPNLHQTADPVQWRTGIIFRGLEQLWLHS